MHKLYPRFVTGPGAVGLFLLRVVAGSAFILHGLGKIQDPFHWMDKLPNAASAPLQALAAVAEFGGGFALILGLFTPIAALGIAANMVVALALVHLPHGDKFVNPGGASFEPPADYLAVMIVLMLLGPGAVSFDYLLFGFAKKEVVAEEEKGRTARWLQ